MFLFAGLASVVILMVMVVLLRERALARRLAAMGDALERRFVERTAELEAVQGELLASERLAALGQLTGTVAHELRNPLSTIANSTAVVERRLADAGIDIGGSPDRIRRSVERCDAIVTELLDFARAQGLDPAPTTVDAWLPEVLAEMALPEGVELRRELGAPGAVVSLDRERVRRAVVNLVQNARDAVADAGGCIRVATRLEDAGIAIEVRDDGTGIPQEILARVREPLFSTKTFGFGLGVPIVERIAAEHGGTLEIDSTPGEETRAVLHLPASPPPSEQASPCVPAAS